MPVLDRGELEESPLSDLHAIASELGIEGYRKLRKDDLIDAILGGGGGSRGSADDRDRGEERPRRRRARGGRGRSRQRDEGDDEEREQRPRRSRQRDEGDDEEREQRPRRARAARAEEPEPEAEPETADEDAEVRAGVLDILPNGSGFMRPQPFAHSDEDVYVSPAQIRRCELRPGDEIEGPVRPPRRSERHPSLVRIDKVNGGAAESGDGRRRFDDMTPVFARRRLAAPEGLDAVPFGRGSRVAVGGPPGAGITSLLRQIVAATAGDDLEVVVVLAGVRPEEVTEWRRDVHVTIAGGGFDRPVDEQAQAAEMAAERGKRAVEQGRDALVVIDSLDALPPAVARRVFGAARATEEGGSLTVVASTGLAGEPMRLATTRIVLDPPTPGEPVLPPRLAPTSGTMRADQLA